jgi:hypothetical protein
LVATCFTPATFTLDVGQSYVVQADSYGNCTFSRWSDEVTLNPRPFTATSGPLSFTAIYNRVTSTATTVSVSTVNSAGHPISGYYVTLWQDGAQIGKLLLPCSFAVNDGQAYQLAAAASYGLETFNHWQNDGSTGLETVNVPSTSTNTTLSYTAVYSP